MRHHIRSHAATIGILVALSLTLSTAALAQLASGPSPVPPTAASSAQPAVAQGSAATERAASGTFPVESRIRVVALILSEALLLIICLLLVGKNFAALILGEDNRYSKSKFQMAVWFGLLIGAYIATVAIGLYKGHPFVHGIDIPKNLVLLSGISAFSFAGAKGITTASQQKALAAAATGVRGAPALRAPNPGKPSFPSDLIVDDTPSRRPDLGDFQMIVVTLLAVLVYLAQVYQFLGSLPASGSVKLPDVDTTILATFGLGQGAYLAKKAVSQ